MAGAAGGGRGPASPARRCHAVATSREAGQPPWPGAGASGRSRRSHEGLDAGRAAHAGPLLPSGRAAVRRQGHRHRHGRPVATASPTGSGPTAPAGSAACSTCSASARAAASPRSRGTSARHLELYFAAPCSGRVLHTLNIRLFPEQLTYIVNHAEDEVIFVDRSLAPLLWPLLPTFDTVKHLVVMDDGKGDVPDDANGITVHDYEELLQPGRAARLRRATTRTRPRRCATRAAPPATPRASSTRTARRSCTRWRR